jgi:hypothetical protein
MALIAWKDNGSDRHVCLVCYGIDKDTIKDFKGTEPIFNSDYGPTGCPKCIICKKKINAIDMSLYKSSSKKDLAADDDESKKSVKEPKEVKRRGRPSKPKPDEPIAKRGRGRPRKIKTELPFNDEPLSEPIVKRGRGRPKGSKNKTGAIK